MKFYAFLLLIAFHTANVYGQVIAIENEKQNILIVGLENPITIAADGYPCKSLILSTNNGTITQRENLCHFVIVPDHPDIQLIVTIKAKTSKGIKDLGVKNFRAKCLPPPAIYILGKNTGNISAKRIHQAIAPVAVQERAEICGNFRITDFTIQVMQKDKNILTKQLHNANGVRFSDDAETQKTIETLQPNDKLIIKDIIYTSFNQHCVSEVNTIDLTITE